MPLVAPSIISADFANLAEEAKRIEEDGADLIHVDIMDGHFVPNITLGPAVTAALRRSTKLFLDVHLMIYNPFDYIERFVEAGANRIQIHFEATEDIEETLKYIHKCNIEAGLVFSPDTSHEMIPKYLELCDTVLIMTVKPGFGGQAFMPQMLEKVHFTREAIERQGLKTQIEVDGGIDEETGALCVEAGASILVAGTYLFKGNLKENIQKLHDISDTR